jgi:hypothetical protein
MAIPRMITPAIAAGDELLDVSDAAVSAPIAPTAPWAKLSILVDPKIRMRPSASNA